MVVDSTAVTLSTSIVESFDGVECPMVKEAISVEMSEYEEVVSMEDSVLGDSTKRYKTIYYGVTHKQCCKHRFLNGMALFIRSTAPVYTLLYIMSYVKQKSKM